VRAWALTEIGRLAAIPPDDPRRPIADDLTGFWRRRVDDSRVHRPGEPHEGDET
jgi:hypothetical protein